MGVYIHMTTTVVPVTPVFPDTAQGHLDLATFASENVSVVADDMITAGEWHNRFFGESEVPVQLEVQLSLLTDKIGKEYTNSMDENSLDDLKKFIAFAISEQISDVRADIKALDEKLSTKMDNLSSSVAEAIDTASGANDNQLKDHEHRISVLEQKAA
jgi:hypothetical protein